MSASSFDRWPWMAALDDGLRARLQQAIEQSPAEWDAVLARSDVAESLERVWKASEFVEKLCSRQPSLLLELATHEDLTRPTPAGWIEADLGRRPMGNTEPEWMDALRRFRKRHMLRIAWRDLAGWSDLDETLADLSMLAETCIRFACQRMTELLGERYGAPRAESDGQVQSLLTLGMGKLGGHELNFSSDIDLVLLYPEAGQTDGARPIDNAEFFLRLGQKMVHLLAATTAEGFVYRVDLRLRPFGDSGPLAVSFAAFEAYLQEHGRDWERYAYVKARAITGEAHYRTLYGDVLRPFVYRRYLDFGVFESLRDMKAMIAREVERRDLQDNVKLGPGGIREIEFIVQAFQLIRGGRDRRLRGRELRSVLPLLAGQRLLRASSVAELHLAYRFLRVVENRLQEWNDEQTHQLPVEAAARLRLAVSMDCDSWEEFIQQLDLHRTRVSGHFAQTMFGPVADASVAAASRAFDIEGPAEECERTLRESGFAEPVPMQKALD